MLLQSVQHRTFTAKQLTCQIRRHEGALTRWVRSQNKQACSCVCICVCVRVLHLICVCAAAAAAQLARQTRKSATMMLDKSVMSGGEFERRHGRPPPPAPSAIPMPATLTVRALTLVPCILHMWCCSKVFITQGHLYGSMCVRSQVVYVHSPTCMFVRGAGMLGTLLSWLIKRQLHILAPHISHFPAE
eukprot:scaffold15749_cov18-Tisochrysis_lutea.AAC.1